MGEINLINDKLPLVLLTGGVDSAFLAYALLHDSPIDILYIEGCQYDRKKEAEKLAVDKIVNFLNNNSPYKIRNNGTVALVTSMDSNHKFGQPLNWIFGVLNSKLIDDAKSVNMAYISGDQMVYHLKDLVIAWEKMTEIALHHKPELLFPLVFKNKLEIYKNIPPELLELTWSCELPIKTEHDLPSFQECGYCRACKIKKFTMAYMESEKNKYSTKTLINER